MTHHVAVSDSSRLGRDLLERDDELSALGRCLEEVARTSCGRIALVSGEAGVGKTALLKRFCEESGQSVRALRGGCAPLFTPRPLGPLLAVAEEAGGEFAEVLANGAMPHELAAALVRELRVRPFGIFLLEDVHWADEATLDVLRLLARRVESVPALIILSWRDDEVERSHPLRIVLGELAMNEPVLRLRLARLSPGAVRVLAEPHAVDAEELYRKTGGNPFFVVEALAAGGEEIPDTVRDAVFTRAARLSPMARQLLDVVAMLPPQAEYWLLEALAGESIDSLEECLSLGILTAGRDGIAFRHELARLAIEESVAPNRKVEVHRNAVVALADPPTGAPDLASLAHHAEAAGDIDAVLRYAPLAAARAAALGAHREAAAQYARALRFGGRLAVEARADLLERRSEACYVTDQYDEGIAALEQALQYRRTLGHRLKEGDALRRLSEFLWCPGRTAEAERYGRNAVAVLKGLPPGAELAHAYLNLAAIAAAASRAEEAIKWAGCAHEVAERVNDTVIALEALAMIAAGREEYERLEQILERARGTGVAESVAFIFYLSAGIAVHARRYDLASRYLDSGIGYCSERGFELFRLYLLAFRARFLLDQGRWSEAADTATAVLRIPRTSTTPRIMALVVLALVRARRGDDEVWPALDEAWALAKPTGELPRIGPVAAARAEAAWLANRHQLAIDETKLALDLALRRRSRWTVGELACWQRRLGKLAPVEAEMAEPYTLQLDGGCVAAARVWDAMGCPYEAALALADADEEDLLRSALERLAALEARPAAAIVARRLRERGARGLPRGPRPTTQQNPGGLTTRELEVLRLLADGARNADIAQELVVSEKTVMHHVSAVLRKLDARTRGEASAKARRLGILNYHPPPEPSTEHG